jgi:hypothetical protein
MTTGHSQIRVYTEESHNNSMTKYYMYDYILNMYRQTERKNFCYESGLNIV